MKHSDVTQNLADYLEGDLSLELRAGVDAHLDGCVQCTREVEEMRRTIGLLRALPDPETPPLISANVMRRIRAGESEQGLIGRIARLAGGVLEPSFVLPASAIAVAALVTMVVRDPTTFSQFQFTTDNVTAGERSVSASPSTSWGRAQPGSGVEIAGLDVSISDALRRSATRQLVGESETAGNPTAPSASSPGTLLYRFEYKVGAPLASRGPIPTTESQSVRTPLYGSSGPARLAPSLASRAARDETAVARRVAQPVRGARRGFESDSAGGEDPRDEWLNRGLESPAEFAHFLAGKNIAEHELWVARLSERAEERGLLNDLVAALRGSGDASAAILSDDFASKARSSDAAPVEWGAPFER